MPGPWYRIGAVRSVNPARRELRIQAEPAFAYQFDGIEWVGIQAGNAAPVLRCKVESARRHEDDVTLRLGAGTTRDAVATMRRAQVLLEQAARKPRPEGFWHPSELEGLKVAGINDEVLGTVREVVETRAHFIIEVAKPEGGSLMLPLVESLVETIDPDAGLIRVGDIAPYVVDDED